MVLRRCFSGLNACSTRFKVLLAVFTICVIVYMRFSGQSSRISILKIDLEESLRASLSSQILSISANLAKSDRLHGQGAKTQLIVDTYNELNKMLVALGHSEHMSDQSTYAPRVTNPDMCQEEYAFKSLSGDYPFFYKGFEMIDCKGVPPFHTLLTLVYNFVHYGAEDLARVPKIISSVNSVYPKLKIIAAIPSSSTFDSNLFNDTEFIKIDTSVQEIDIWGTLIVKVKTKYVYIGRNVVHFTWFDRLERLVREVGNLDAAVVASAFRTFVGGQWTHGCDQSLLQNYTLTYREGYRTSVEECMLCHHVHGPFVVKTELIRKLPLPRMTTSSSFAEWFLKMKSLDMLVVSCPDSMAFVSDSSQRPTSKSDWKDLALSLQVERVRPRPKELFEFDCDEANTHCSEVKVSGLALSNCCTKELSDAIKLIMQKCKEGGMLCEPSDGTLLGMIKFRGLIPWELDADLALHGNNATAFATKYKPFFTELGYKWETGNGFHKLYTANWKVEMFTLNRLNSEQLIKQGISPTLVELDGTYFPAPESPGLHSRNRYGEEMYKHAQHYSQSGKVSGWDFYGAKTFVKCPKPGHHACLDQFIPDGNLLFEDSLP